MRAYAPVKLQPQTISEQSSDTALVGARSCLIKGKSPTTEVSPWLKPSVYRARSGTAKAVHFQIGFMRLLPGIPVAIRNQEAAGG